MTDPLDICPEMRFGPAPEREVAGLLIHTERVVITEVTERAAKVLYWRNGIDLYEHLKQSGYDWGRG